MSLDFTKIDTGTIASGIDSDGIPYLQKFLIEYTNLFGGKVNPGCPKCLADYHAKYIRKMSENKISPENSGFKLHAKYEGIPLEFGSQVMVTNANLTDAYAKILLSHEDGERFFAAYPDGFDKETFFAADTEEPVTREALSAAVDAAKAHIAGLGEKPHHAKKAKAERLLAEAEEALKAYDDAHQEPADTDAAAGTEVNDEEHVS